MVKLTAFLMLCFLFASVVEAKKPPSDIPTIEALISKHKSQYNKLKDREEEEVKHTSISTVVKDVSTKYEQLHKELSSKYAILASWLNIGIDGLALAKNIKATIELIPEYVKYSSKVKNVFILKEYVKSIVFIKDEISLCKELAVKIATLRANAKEISEIIAQIQMRVTRINYFMRNAIFLAQGYIAMENLGLNSYAFIDKAKIVNEIISSF